LAAATGPRAAKKGLSFRDLMQRADWKPLPAIVVLTGTADFLKTTIIHRFTRELFGEDSPEIHRFHGPAGERQLAELPLSTVLDELRTPSFFSPRRLVLLYSGNAFVAAHGEDLCPFIEQGFAGGHFIIVIDGKLDGRTRFAKQMASSGWVVDCAQPFDRPPPWDTRTPIWDSELSHWVVHHAHDKGLQISTEVAFHLHQRAGTDLTILDEEMEKISTYLASKKQKKVDEEVIRAVVGDLHEDSVFEAVDLFLEGRQTEALDATERMFTHGVHTDRGAVNLDPTSLALLFIGACVPRLRALRRAHALRATGQGPDEWIREKLVQRPFLVRFQRQLAGLPPRRLIRVLDRLYDIDKAIKTGSPAARMIELLVLECGK
jgi:DNA polymerase III delta subunit